jgi:hypothetical protein
LAQQISQVGVGVERRRKDSQKKGMSGKSGAQKIVSKKE